MIFYFIFSAEILGEINNYYGSIPGWDTILHTLNVFLCAAVGFAVVDMLQQEPQNKNVAFTGLFIADGILFFLGNRHTMGIF